MNPISDARTDLAARVAALLDGVPVYSEPPENVTLPCAIVSDGRALRQTRCGWALDLNIDLLTRAGTNTNQVAGLEDMVLTLAESTTVAILEMDEPGTTTIAGHTALSARLITRADIQIGS